MSINLNVNQTVKLTIQAADTSSADKLGVNIGEQYQFTCAQGQTWKDANIVSTPDGYFNFFGWLAGMRVKKVKCFCLCGMYNEDITTGFAIGSNNSLVITAVGSISFFANDTPGYYGNNSGSIDVNITRLK